MPAFGPGNSGAGIVGGKPISTPSVSLSAGTSPGNFTPPTPAPAVAKPAPAPTPTPAPNSAEQRAITRAQELKHTPVKFDDSSTESTTSTTDVPDFESDDVELTNSETDGTTTDNTSTSAEATDTTAGSDDAEPSFEVPAGDDTVDETTDTDENKEVPAPHSNEARDYSKFHPDTVPALKALRNNDFRKYASKIDEWRKAYDDKTKLEAELKTAKEGTPKYLAEHPQAYTLLPEYQELTQAVEGTGFEAAHWEQQLINLERGEAWVELTGYDGRTGEPKTVQHPAREDGRVDVEAKIKVQNRYNQAQAIQQQSRNQVQRLAGGYKERVNNAQAQMAEHKAKLFKGMDSTKLEGPEQKYYKDVLNLVPDIYKEHPMTDVLGLAFVAHRRLLNQFQAYMKKHGGNGSAVQPGKPALPRVNGGNGVVGGKSTLIDVENF